MTLLETIHSLTTMADKIIFIIAVVFIGWLYFHYWLSTDRGTFALITYNNTPIMRINLQQDKKFTVKGYLGVTEVEVDQGRIRFLQSPCRGKHCIHAGWLSRAGDFVACLPNHLTIQVFSENNEQFDAISY